MMKSKFSKALALMSAVGVLGVSMLSASAADPSVLSVGSAEANAGEEVSVDLSIAGNPGVSSMGIKLDIGNLEFVGVDDGLLMTSADLNGTILTITGMSSSDKTKDGAIATITFKVPDDATPGTVYDITWSLVDQFSSMTTEAKDSLTTEPGQIIVPETTTPPEETTTAADTTIAADTTTAATTTTAKAVTEAPKTGTKGIAATAVVLLAAACSAVAVKKKKD